MGHMRMFLRHRRLEGQGAFAWFCITKSSDHSKSETRLSAVPVAIFTNKKVYTSRLIGRSIDRWQPSEHDFFKNLRKRLETNKYETDKKHYEIFVN